MEGQHPTSIADQQRKARHQRFRADALQERRERRTGALVGGAIGLALGVLWHFVHGVSFAVSLPLGAAAGVFFGWIFGPRYVHWLIWS